MKSILERALVHLLNEENEKAEELLHQFVIETARNIHETLRESDEDDAGDDEDSDDQPEYFQESDLDHLEDHSEDEAVADLGDDLGQDMPDAAEGEELADDSLEADAAIGDDIDAGQEEGGDIEAEIENFEQELADLQAKFDAMLADIEGEDDVADEGEEDLGGMDDLTAEPAEDDLGDLDAHGEEGEFDDEKLVKEGADEDFDDITESIVDELQKVAADNREGMTTNGENHLGNKQSSKFNKPEASAGKLSSTKRVGHTGFARETAPSTQPLKGGKTVASTKMRNVRADADAGNHKVTGKSEGPKAAIRAVSKDAAHAKGPISGKPLGKK